MFIFPDKPEQLCLVVTSMDGVYSFVDLTFGNLYEIKDVEESDNYASTGGAGDGDLEDEDF